MAPTPRVPANSPTSMSFAPQARLGSTKPSEPLGNYEKACFRPQATVVLVKTAIERLGAMSTSIRGCVSLQERSASVKRLASTLPGSPLLQLSCYALQCARLTGTASPGEPRQRSGNYENQKDLIPTDANDAGSAGRPPGPIQFSPKTRDINTS